MYSDILFSHFNKFAYTRLKFMLHNKASGADVRNNECSALIADNKNMLTEAVMA